MKSSFSKVAGRQTTVLVFFFLLMAGPAWSATQSVDLTVIMTDGEKKEFSFSLEEKVSRPVEVGKLKTHCSILAMSSSIFLSCTETKSGIRYAVTTSCSRHPNIHADGQSAQGWRCYIASGVQVISV